MLIAQEFVRNEMKFTGLAKILLSPFYDLPKEAEELTQETKSTLKAFKEFEKEVKIDEEQVILEYVSKQKMRPGSIRETDAITLIIKDFIQRIKKARINQLFILILDDLDRLDPEQVFRVYNLFTAHHDSRNEAGYFGVRNSWHYSNRNIKNLAQRVPVDNSRNPVDQCKTDILSSCLRNLWFHNKQ